MIIEKSIAGSRYLYLATGMDPRMFAHSTITDYLHEEGCCINQAGTAKCFSLNETVILFNTVTQKEEVYIVLPFEYASPLVDLAGLNNAGFGSVQREKNIRLLRQVYRFFLYLEKARKTEVLRQDFFRAVLAAPMCLLVDNTSNELIVLPPRLILRCITVSQEYAMRFHYFWLHPDGDNASYAEAAVFFLASLSYVCLTGIPPFSTYTEPFPPLSGANMQSGTVEQLVQNMRDAAFVPAVLYCPNVRPSFTALIDSGLSVQKKQQEDTVILLEQLCAYHDETIPIFVPHPAGTDATIVDIPAAETDDVRLFIKKNRRKINCKRFFIKNRGKIAAGAVCAAIIISISAAVIAHFKHPPATAGLSASAVVHELYAAINTLDQAKISAYTKNKAGTEYENLILHLFITEKMREVYEQKKIYYSPEEFFSLCAAVSDSAQELENTVDSFSRFKTVVTAALNGGSIYGISQLAIMPVAHHQKSTAVTGGFDEAEQFEAVFYYWVPLFPSETAEALLQNPPEQNILQSLFPVQIFYYRDKITLIKTEQSFFVGSIEPLERTLLLESSNVLFETCFSPPEQHPAYLENQAQFCKDAPIK